MRPRAPEIGGSPDPAGNSPSLMRRVVGAARLGVDRRRTGRADRHVRRSRAGRSRASNGDMLWNDRGGMLRETARHAVGHMITCP